MAVTAPVTPEAAIVTVGGLLYPVRVPPRVIHEIPPEEYFLCDAVSAPYPNHFTFHSAPVGNPVTVIA